MKRGLVLPFLLCAMVLTGFLLACGGGGGGSSGQSAPWAWMSGINGVDTPAVYGTESVANPANMPGARFSAVSWVGDSGDLWLFGGWGNIGSVVNGYLNDLWRYDGTQWTWSGGLSTTNVVSVYGTIDVANPANGPGGRIDATGWKVPSGGVWIFGGNGKDTVPGFGPLNDLWLYDAGVWTWKHGSTTTRATGVYGSLGVADPTYTPGAMSLSASWIDSNDNLWLFGGYGYGASGAIQGNLNDLWMYDGLSWRWMGGLTAVNGTATYGTKGVANPLNWPGSRRNAASCADSNGDFWLFGGRGMGTVPSEGDLSDLWKFDGTAWTWMAGRSSTGGNGQYIVLGGPDPLNRPGAREGSNLWCESPTAIWLFGGQGYDGSTDFGELGDLWLFNGSQWAWMGGSDTRYQTGVYGTQGTADPANIPGARERAISWIDGNGDLWLFGGNGYDSAGSDGRLNDLWRYSQ